VGKSTSSRTAGSSQYHGNRYEFCGTALDATTFASMGNNQSRAKQFWRSFGGTAWARTIIFLTTKGLRLSKQTRKYCCDDDRKFSGRFQPVSRREDLRPSTPYDQVASCTYASKCPTLDIPHNNKSQRDRISAASILPDDLLPMPT